MTHPKLAKLPPVLQSPVALGNSVATCGGGLAIDPVPAATLQKKPTLLQMSQALDQRYKDQPPAHTCQQKLSINVFFDGTGNNLKADLPTLEHSNVARLFRAMPLDDEVQGIFSRYVPGIGTFFPEIGDPARGRSRCSIRTTALARSGKSASTGRLNK